MKKGTHVNNWNLSLVAILLVGICYLGLMQFLGTSSPFLLVQGTSMEPTYHQGNLLLNRRVPATEIEVGDVISFRVPSDYQERLGVPSKVVHRVIDIKGEQGELVFVTQGDNSDVDPFDVPSSAVNGVVIRNLGPWGAPLLLLGNKSLLLLLGVPILAFLGIMLATLSFWPDNKGESAAKSGGGVGIDKAVATLAAAVSEYGTHLKSHTAVVMNLADTTDELRQATHDHADVATSLRQAVLEQNQVLATLREAKFDSPRRCRGSIKKVTKPKSSTAKSVTTRQELIKLRTESTGSTAKPAKAKQGPSDHRAESTESTAKPVKINQRTESAGSAGKPPRKRPTRL